MKTETKIAAAFKWLTRSMFGLSLLAGLFTSAPQLAYAKSEASAQFLDKCDWARPGVNPFLGDVVGAVDDYTDIPAPVRERLKARIRDRNYDEIVTIGRDAIVGDATYDARISAMHFGGNKVCRQVTRAAWSDKLTERGMVFCEQGHCLMVPTVCRNVARIKRLAEPKHAMSGLHAADGDDVADDALAFGGGIVGPMPVYRSAFNSAASNVNFHSSLSQFAQPSWIGSRSSTFGSSMGGSPFGGSPFGGSPFGGS
ncbi:MAG: MHFG family PEP-CTERM protein, partial [Pseudomonadota bacterium]